MIARVLRALERWHPGYIDWWKTMGPEGFQEALVYLRTAVSVDPKGWAKFDYVKMPDYRWGILLAPQEEGPHRFRFGRHWASRPGRRCRANIAPCCAAWSSSRATPSPPSVEQQRHLGKTAPSLYDMRNLFQVNVEEGRHLWAMVYLLQKYFGRDGREEAEELLQRRSGNADKPRMLGAFNEATPDWLSFFMFTIFTDRDGKMQLESLAQSGFDPLSRTCRFMLTEEAHHMFVGETGVGRILQRTCEAMKQAGIEDVRRHRQGARARRDRPADHAEKAQPALTRCRSTCSARRSRPTPPTSYNAGLKGRFQETKIEDDHKLESCDLSGARNWWTAGSSASTSRRSPPSTCGCATTTWPIASAASIAGTRSSSAPASISSSSCRTSLSIAQIGEFRDINASPDGELLDDAAWQREKDKWLPSAATATSSAR